MFAYWLATKQRWGWFWVAAIIALSCKEDAGLAVLALGLVLWIKNRQRAMGLATSIVGAGWFLACTKLIIPAANGGGEPFYTALFPGYGNSVFAIAETLVFHPMRWIKTCLSKVNLTYYTQLFWPVGLVALLEPTVLLVAVPQLLVNSISTEGYTNSIQYYYTSIVLAGIFLATVEACARRGRTSSGRRLDGGARVRGGPRRQRGVVTVPYQCQVPRRILGRAEPEGRDRSTRRSPSSDDGRFRVGDL